MMCKILTLARLSQSMDNNPKGTVDQEFKILNYAPYTQ